MNELQAEAEASPEVKPQATLDGVHAMGLRAAKLEAEIETIEEKLKKLKTERYDLLNKKMPADMIEAKVRVFEVDGFIVECKPYYKANISADDPDDKRQRAFAWLDEAGGGDIVNNVVTVAFPKEDSEDAKAFFEEIRNRFDNRSIEVVCERKVPWNRLTKWLREYVERKLQPGEPPKLAIPLEDLNATLGNVVQLKRARQD